MINNDKYKTMPKEIYYSIKEISEMLKVSYITVYRWVQSGLIGAVKIGKQYRIEKNSLEEFLILSKFRK